MNPFINAEKVTISTNNSTLIKNIEWKRNDQTSNVDPKGDLRLTFIKGEIYEYIEVPSNIIYKLLTSKSIGNFFHSNIKGKYITHKEKR